MPSDTPTAAANTAEPFDRARRRVRRDRAAARIAAHGFLVEHMAEELLARLEAVERTFSRALVVGYAPAVVAGLEAKGIATVTADPSAALARRAGGVQCDEDRLPFADASFDLVVTVGVLDQVNDLPGALLLMRRILRPDGLLLAAFAGAGSLPRLRAAMLAGDMAGGGVSPRIHPQVDVRSTGDLLARAGFALPVADGDRLEVRYRSLDSLLADLRFGGMGGMLADRPAPLGRMQAAAAAIHFAGLADDEGRVTERFELVYGIGWAPDASQPKPARRGSGMASLTQALPPRRPAG